MAPRPRPSTFLIAALILAAAGCSSGGSGGSGGPGPKDAGDWHYDPPDGFKQQDQQKDGATVFMGPEDSGFKTNLVVRSGNNSRENAKQIGQDILAKMTAQSGVTVKEQEPYDMAGSDAYTWLVSKTGKSGKVAGQRQFILVKDGVVVLFTMTASDKTISQYDQVLADSLKTFHWGR